MGTRRGNLGNEANRGNEGVASGDREAFEADQDHLAILARRKVLAALTMGMAACGGLVTEGGGAGTGGATHTLLANEVAGESDGNTLGAGGKAAGGSTSAGGKAAGGSTGTGGKAAGGTTPLGDESGGGLPIGGAGSAGAAGTGGFVSSQCGCQGAMCQGCT